MEAAHSKLGASSMYRWKACPGSVNLCKGIPSQTSSYAEEGTLMHEVASKWLLDGEEPKLDEVELEQLRIYIDAVKEDAAREPASVVMVEHRFQMPVVEGAFGTADAVIWLPISRILIVHDLKWGAGIPVEVLGNVQLQYYALGALLSLNLPAVTVEMAIAQPRCPHRDGEVRRWRISAVELLDFEADLVEAAAKTRDPNAPLVAGDHCRFCPAAATCPALHGKAKSLAKLEFSEVAKYKPVDLSLALEWAGKMESWAKSVREFAYGEALHGRVPPGWKLVQKRAVRRWTANVGAETLAKAVGGTFTPKDFLTEPEVLSPAQAEKVAGKGGKTLLAPLIVSESSGYALAHESDARPPTKLDAASEFTKIA